MKGLMHLLEKRVPFIWDNKSHFYFDVHKTSLKSTQLLSPMDYSKDFLLDLTASESTIGMVLGQEDDSK